nr:hypothetical protein [Tanacetum cinerariifolium]
MATKIEQQAMLDEALVPSTKRLRIGRSNFRLPSDIQSKESTLQVVYDVLLSGYLKRKYYRGYITEDTSTMPFSSGKILCIKWNTRIKRKQRDVLPTIHKSHHSSLHDEETFNPKTQQGKQPARATSPTDPSDVEWTEAEQLKIVLRRSRHETHISQQGGSSTDKGTGSIPGVLDVPSDDSEEEISWNSSNDEDVDDQTK